METAPARYFSADYTEARANFLSAALAADASTKSFVLRGHRGPEGEELAMDVASLGPDEAEAGLVLVSATHGVEGFCGAGCQTGLLSSGALRDLAARMHILLIHAHNPYGFAWLRRVNEDNVDLNRNYVDHNAPHPDNPDYERLKESIAPRSLDEETLAAATAALNAYSEAHGAFALQGAMTRGQYTHADGLYYGGRAPTWSNRTLTTALSGFMRSQARVALIDFHTGLGPFGHGEIINEYEPGSAGDARLSLWFGDEARSAKRGESVSVELSGTIDSGLARILPQAETTCFALEFGTVRTAEVFAATRADNWLYLYGDPGSAQGRAIKAELRRVFYPDSEDWKRRVWERALDVTLRTGEGLLGTGESLQAKTANAR